jgi:hypothetical protein
VAGGASLPPQCILLVTNQTNKKHKSQPALLDTSRPLGSVSQVVLLAVNDRGHSSYTVLKAAHISEKYLRVYMGASPLAGKFLKAVYPFSLRKFPKAFNPSPFGNFLKHLILLPSEISEKSREDKKNFYWYDSICCPPDLIGNTITFTLLQLMKIGIFFTTQL